MDTFKKTFQKLRTEMNAQKLCNNSYHLSPHSMSPEGKSLLGRKGRTTLSIPKPSATFSEISRNYKVEEQFNRNFGEGQNEFLTGELVWTMDYGSRTFHPLSYFNTMIGCGNRRPNVETRCQLVARRYSLTRDAIWSSSTSHFHRAHRLNRRRWNILPLRAQLPERRRKCRAHCRLRQRPAIHSGSSNTAH